jgi:cerevisin
MFYPLSISGLVWVAIQALSSGRPSIATMSLGGGTSPALDIVVYSLTKLGIHVTVAGQYLPDVAVMSL